MQKRNWKTKVYEPYSIPKDWYCPLVMDDMKQEINCTDCGSIVEYGKTYTSRSIHSTIGFGYPVCEQCYQKDLSSMNAADD